MKEFIEDELGYMKWLEDNPNGYVLNSHTNISPRYLPLHRATCRTIKKYKSSASEESFTGGDYKKLCFESAKDIANWMLQNYPYSTKCSHCKPNIYFSKREYQDALDAEVSDSLRNPSNRKKQLETTSKTPQKYTTTAILYTRNPHVIAERLAIAKGTVRPTKSQRHLISETAMNPF